jgi:propionyl-CoA carboxylase alpha chain
VIEEAPSSAVDDKTRLKMMKQCVALAKEVDYYSAGTVEFIMDKDKGFYFLEMNTRLQVEHPVTEFINNIDIVEQMLRIAYGEKLPLAQKDVKLQGWAMEARIYAEDPTRGFLPSSGRISEYHEPEETLNVRVDSGVYEGGQVSMFYDAMVAKLITYGDTRKEALDHMKVALGKYVICGISHNLSFLQALFAHDRFASGDINTNFIEEEYPEGFSGAELTSEKTKVLLCTAIHVFMEDTRRAAGLSGNEGHVSNRWVVNIGDESFPVFVKCMEHGYELLHDAERLHVTSSWILGTRLFQGMVNGTPIHVQAEPSASGYHLIYEGTKARVSVRSPRVAELEKFMPKTIETIDDSVVKAPISGLIVTMKVKPGDKVKAGQELFILEAMKMENIICAEKDAVVEKIHVGNGDNVAYDQDVINWKDAS